MFSAGILVFGAGIFLVFSAAFVLAHAIEAYLDKAYRAYFRRYK